LVAVLQGGGGPADYNQIVPVDTSGGPVPVILPPALDHAGEWIIVKDLGGAAGISPITILTTGGDVIDVPGPPPVIGVAFGALMFHSDGVATWIQTAKF
jgi:hypothetical protein